MNTPLVIVGGGPGGYAAAFLAADLGMEVTLVEQRPRLGGVCLLQGCIPSKALLHVARTLADARELAEWGVALAEPEIDIDALRARKDKIVDTLTGGLQQLAKRRKVQVIHARAEFADSQTLQLQPAGDTPLDAKEIRFEHCIVATGSRPASIPGLDVASPRVMDSAGALALADVPESLLVVGGGYIGLELGSVYAALGSRVSVVEMTGGLLPGADRDLVRPLGRRLDGLFEAVQLNTKVVSLTPGDDSVEVMLDGDVEQPVQRFSRVLVSVGRRPNSEGLGLENTQVEIDGQGFLVVDEQRRTADPHILAIGDVAGQPMLAHKAAHEGKTAVEALAGRSVAFRPRAIPAVVFTDPQIAWAGLTETEAKSQGRRVTVGRFPWAACGRALAVGRTEGMTKWLIDPETEQLIGCGIVGPEAGELIGEAVVAIETGRKIHDVAHAIHPHPTLSETLSAAAEIPLGTATDIYRPKR